MGPGYVPRLIADELRLYATLLRFNHEGKMRNLSCLPFHLDVAVSRGKDGVSSLVATSVAGAPPIERLVEVTAFVQSSKVTLLSAVIAARTECSAGTPFRAGISRRHPAHAFEILILVADRKRVVRVEIDAICGEAIGVDEEPMTPIEIASLLVFARNRPDRLEAALKRASEAQQGTAIAAELRERKNAPPIAAVTVLTPTGFSDLLIDSTDDEPVELVRRTN